MPHPAVNKLSLSQVFDGVTGKPKPEAVMRHFVQEGRLEEDAALAILNKATALLRAEMTMLEMEAPVTGELLFTWGRFPYSSITN